MKSFFPILLLVIFGVSCLDEPDCIGLHNNIVGVTVKDKLRGAALFIPIDSILFDGVGRIYNYDSTNTFVLPINYYEQQSSYSIYIDGVKYKLALSYLSQPQFVSPKCGTRFQVSGLAVKETGFDSVRVVNGTPGVSTTAKNVEIFR
jgi:hypothetical protein